ncbi:MAG: winged helix-turn-helix domain-containing protein [Vicinamibacteria bacterium]
MSEGLPAIQEVENDSTHSWTGTETGFPGEGFQFGIFELDTRTGELRKEGRLVRLRNQPFKVLCMLLDRAGELVSRDAIKGALWADTVDVDVEQGLNYCVKEIRSTLGDNAESPVYVQTLPRRGYRFMATVSRLPPALTETQVDRELSSATPGTTSEAASRRTRTWGGALAVILILSTIAVLPWLRDHVRSPPKTRDPASMRLVVLPFTDLSETPQAYLADGLSDELISSLGRETQGRIGVIARSSSLAFRDRPRDAAAFAREIGATYFVEGTVRRDSASVRVSVALARSEDGTQVWSQTYDRSVNDLLKLKDEVVDAIGSSVSVAVNAETNRNIVTNSDAYLAYLRGRFEWNKRTTEGLHESLAIFQSLTKDNPDFALGFAGLADAYSVLMDRGDLPAKEAWPQARAAAEKAVALDPGLAEAWTSLAMIRGLYEWNPEGAEEAFAKAEALNPNYAMRLHWRSILLRTEGRNEEALVCLRRARDLDPLSLVIRVNLGGALLDLKRTDEALKEAESLAAIAPDWPSSQILLGDTLDQLHRESEAETAYKKAAAKSDPGLAEISAFYSRTARPELARQTLDELRAHATSSYVSPYLIAVAAAGLDRELAFASLEAAFNERSSSLRLIRSDPRLKPLAVDPRFQRWLRVLWPGQTPGSLTLKAESHQ